MVGYEMLAQGQRDLTAEQVGSKTLIINTGPKRRTFKYIQSEMVWQCFNCLFAKRDVDPTDRLLFVTNAM